MSQDILAELNLSMAAHQIEMTELIPADETESVLLRHLSAEPAHIDDVRRECGLPIATVTERARHARAEGPRPPGWPHELRPHRRPRMNVDPLVAEARPIVEKAASVYIHHTRQYFVGLIVHGSALKGGFIPVQRYRHAALRHSRRVHRRPPAVGADGGDPPRSPRIDLAPFRYIQCYAFSGRMAAGWVGPVPGAYHVIAGRLPIPEATPDELFESARRSSTPFRSCRRTCGTTCLNTAAAASPDWLA